MKIMLWKEWRESIRWMPIPVVTFSVLLWLAMPDRGAQTAGFSGEIAGFWAIAAAIAAGLIGVLQTLPESRTDTRGLLLARPLSRENILFAKSIVAAAIYSLSLGIPLLVAALWISVVAPETRAADPIQMLAGVIVGIGCFAFHPAACWMVSRPANWIGTRMLPLVIAGGVSFVGFAVVMSVSSWGWLWMTTAALIGSIALLHLAARHAFVQLTNLPPLAEPRSTSKLASTLMVIACLIVVTTAGALAISSIPALQPDYSDYTSVNLRVNDEGQIYNTTEKSRYDGDTYQNVTTILGASPAIIVPTGQPLPDVPPPRPYADQPLAEATAFRPTGAWLSPVLSPFDRWPVQIGNYEALYHRDGYYLLYDRYTSRFHGKLTRGGIGDGGERFDGPAPTTMASALLSEWPSIDLNDHRLLVDRGGVYQLGDDKRSLRTLAEYPIDSAALIPPSENRPPRLWLQNSDQVTLFELSSIEPNKPLPTSKDAERPTRLPQLAMTQVRTFQLGMPVGNLFVADREQHEYIFLNNIKLARTHYDRFDSSGKPIEDGDIAIFVLRMNRIDANLVISTVFPPAMMMVIGAVEVVDRSLFDGGFTPHTEPRAALVLLLLVTLHVVMAATLTAWASRRRHLGHRKMIVWMIVSVFLGLATALAVLAIYPKMAREACHGCGAKVRVDQEKCPTCGVRWEPPPCDGCEIFEQDHVVKTDSPAIA